MAINIQAKQDISYLFSGLGNGAANVASSNFLSDYAAIKNGSYGKLMKAYYSKDGNDSLKSIVNNRKTEVSSEEAKALTKVQNTTDALKESADALLVKGSKSVFEKKDVTTTDEFGIESTTKEYNTEAIYKAVDDFVKNYNSVINAVNDVDNKSIITRASSMVTNSIANLKMLNQVGITINADSTLSLDKASFMKADMGKVQTLFAGNGSYGYQASAKASMMSFAAENAISKAGTYTESGTYNNYGVGNLFNSYF